MKPQKQGRPKKQCFFKANNIEYVDFTDVKLLQKFMTESGKILPSRITGVSAVFQRRLASAIKTARHAGLIAARQSY